MENLWQQWSHQENLSIHWNRKTPIMQTIQNLKRKGKKTFKFWSIVILFSCYDCIQLEKVHLKYYKCHTCLQTVLRSIDGKRNLWLKLCHMCRLSLIGMDISVVSFNFVEHKTRNNKVFSAQGNRLLSVIWCYLWWKDTPLQTVFPTLRTEGGVGKWKCFTRVPVK